MKKALCSFFLISCFILSRSQSQADIDKMVKQSQDAMKDLPPEARHTMDSLGIKMPDMNSLPKSGDIAKMQTNYQNQLAQNKKDAQTAVSNLPRKAFSEAELSAFLINSFQKIEKGTSEKAKVQAARIIADSKSKGRSLQNSAIFALMAKGRPEALYILAKLAAENPGDANLLCNYAAVASISGGAHLAIPVLNYLNRKYPGNSSVLSNLGNAWFCLNKTDSAEKFLRLALRIYPAHYAANRDMAEICGGAGNSAERIEHLKKAIKNAYTEKAAADLKTAGVKLTRKDINWPFNTPTDPAGMDKIDVPEFPYDTKSCDALAPQWAAFTTLCKAKAKEYEAEQTKLGQELTLEQQTQMTNAMKTRSTAGFVSPYAEQAGIYFKDDAEAALRDEAKAVEALANAQVEIRKLGEAESKRDSAIDAAMDIKYKRACPGEGCPMKQYCPELAKEMNASSDAFLKPANSVMSAAVKAELDALKRGMSIKINLATFTATSDTRLRYEVVSAKAAYMSALGDIECQIRLTASDNCGAVESKPGKVKLADFDEVTCKSENKLYIGIGIGKVSITCTKFSIEGGEFLQGSYEEDIRTGAFEIGIGIGVAEHFAAGPLSAEASAKIMEIYCFNGKGEYVDMGVKASAGIAANIGALNAETEGSLKVMIHGDSAAELEGSAGVKFLQD